VLLFGAENVTVTRNTFVGLGTDIGIAVAAGSTGNTVSFNRVTRSPSNNPDNTDATGIGIYVNSGEAESPSSATLICNTFNGWNQNIVGEIQINCGHLPPGTECRPYSAHLPAVHGVPDVTTRGESPKRVPTVVTWTLESGTLPPGLALATGGAITGNPPDHSAGTYQFTVRATEATGLTATQDQTIRIRPGCQATPSTPVVRTATSHDRVTPGRPFYDRIHVKRLAGSQGATAVAQLYGPFTSRAAATCRPALRVRTKTLHVHNGWNRAPKVQVSTRGVYTWRVTLRANDANRSATHRCGLAAETTTVAKQGYVAPAVDAGFSGTIDSPDLARRAPTPVTIQMPAIGLHAPVLPEGIVRGQMTLPADVHDVGWLRKSAGIGDKIGTTVIAGHVSDRHDNPGAMFHLSQAHTGQRVTVTRDGTPYRFKVASTATFNRNHKIPHRYVVTTGPHRLALISCTHKVVFPNGHFHYTHYIVVIANQIHHHS
jgi:hypothetical protein